MTNQDIEKLNNRKSFLFPLHLNYLITKDMTDHEAGTLIKSIMEYVTSGILPDFKDRTFAKSGFGQFKEAYDKEAEKYINECNTKKQKALEREEKKRKESEKHKHPKYG